MKWWRAHGARINSLSLSEVNLYDDARVRGCLVGREELRIAVGKTLTFSGHKNGGSFRDFVEQNMTPIEIARATDLHRECVRKKYKGC